MNTTLEQMQPLLYPPPVPAMGGYWFYVLALALILLGLCTLLLWRLARAHKQARHPPEDTSQSLRQHALIQLAQLDKPLPGELAGPWLQQLNQLLKRLCSAHYPELASHRLSGRDWLAFLDSRCPAAGLTRWMILVDGSYQPECRMHEDAVHDLYCAIEIWINKHV